MWSVSMIRTVGIGRTVPLSSRYKATYCSLRSAAAPNHLRSALDGAPYAIIVARTAP